MLLPSLNIYLLWCLVCGVFLCNCMSDSTPIWVYFVCMNTQQFFSYSYVWWKRRPRLTVFIILHFSVEKDDSGETGGSTTTPPADNSAHVEDTDHVVRVIVSQGVRVDNNQTMEAGACYHEGSVYQDGQEVSVAAAVKLLVGYVLLFWIKSDRKNGRLKYVSTATGRKEMWPTFL